MSLSLILIFIIAVGAFVYILSPLRRPAPVAVPQARAAQGRVAQGRVALVEQRDALLRELKDLEFEHQMGKIDSEDYQAMQANVSSRTAEVLRRLEATRDTGGDFSQWRARLWDLEAEAEILIARTRHKLTANGVNGLEVNKPIEAANSWKCPQCGRVMPQTDRFCGSCGTKYEA